jgi:hypothetical protein
MAEHKSKKVTVEVTPEQQELLELVEPREVPHIYRGLEYMWQRAMFEGREVIEQDGQTAGYHLWKVMETIGRINPDFNPLQD